jgi:hypothetical protein
MEEYFTTGQASNRIGAAKEALKEFDTKMGLRESKNKGGKSKSKRPWWGHRCSEIPSVL